MLSSRAVHKLLKPYELDLSDSQVEKVLTYLNLLLRWNEKINLTAIRNPEECVTRHFAESFLLSKAIPLAGSLMDIGSGAGFPGLALKILNPGMTVLLLEPVGKKRAFLKEVANICQLGSVSVAGTTIQEFSRQHAGESFDIITIRAVGNLPSVIPSAVDCLKAFGHLCLWIGSNQAEEILWTDLQIQWKDLIPIPFTRERRLLIGTKVDVS